VAAKRRKKAAAKAAPKRRRKKAAVVVVRKLLSKHALDLRKKPGCICAGLFSFPSQVNKEQELRNTRFNNLLY